MESDLWERVGPSRVSGPRQWGQVGSRGGALVLRVGAGAEVCRVGWTVVERAVAGPAAAVADDWG